MIRQAYKGEISLTFNYKEFPNSVTQNIEVEPERISYLMIEHLYNNIHILPVIYISANITSSMYTKIVNTPKTSTFTLKIKKKNVLINTSVNTTVVNDIFSYVSSATEANYSEKLNDNQAGYTTAYKDITLGLVSIKATNLLRQSYNGIYNNIKQSDLINLALKDLPNVTKENLNYDYDYKSFIIPPLSSRYKLLDFLFNKDPFYNSIFTFYMDFNNTYLISRNANGVNRKDGIPSNLILDIKTYDVSDAVHEGFDIKNDSYIMYINAANVNVKVNNALDKLTNQIISYSDDNDVQKLNLDINRNYQSDTKVMFVRNKNAAALKNEYGSSNVILEITKQNIDSNLINPNIGFNISNYKDFKNYNGRYYLYYKREFYYKSDSNSFTITCNIGLKKAINEEVAKSIKDTNKNNNIINSSKISTSSSLKGTLKSVPADRRKK